MNAKELADAVVALGVGEHCGEWFGIMAFDTALEGEILDPHDADRFVRDWRVAGALMEKATDTFVRDIILDRKCRAEKVYRVWVEDNGFPAGERPEISHCRGESLPRAIIEACVEALS